MEKIITKQSEIFFFLWKKVKKNSIFRVKNVSQFKQYRRWWVHCTLGAIKSCSWHRPLKCPRFLPAYFLRTSKWIFSSFFNMYANMVFFCPLQMYSAVYKCVCKHFAEQLHADLCHHVLQVVQRWSTDLLQLSQAEDKIPFLVKTDYFLSQFSNALSSIVPLFTYLVNGQF